MNGIDLNIPRGPSSTPRRQRRAGSDSSSGPRLKTLAAATAVALLLLPGMRETRAQVIGDLDVRSRLGERFFGAVPVQTGGALLDPRCIRVSPNPGAPAGAEPLQGVRVRIGSGPVDSVLIETLSNVTSPMVGIRLEVGCDNPVTRDFLVLGEGVPLPGAPDTIATAPAAADTTAQAPAAQAAVTPQATARAPVRAAQAPAPRAQQRAAPRVAQPTDAIARAPVAAPQAAEVVRVPARPAEAVPPVAPRRAVADTAAAVDQDNTRRLAELRARNDDQAASLLALEDRLALLQKQAEMLKAQLEYVLANASAATQASTPAASAPAAPAATAPAAAAAPAMVAAANTTTPIATATQAAPSTAAAAAPRKSQSVVDLLTDWRVAAGGLTALLLGAIVLKMRRRPSKSDQRMPAPVFVPSATATWQKSPQPEAARPAGAATPQDHERTQEFRAPPQIARAEETVEWRTAPRADVADRTAEWVAPPTTDTLPVPESSPAPAAAKSRLPGAGISREFHITQQFQPVAERIVALSSPEEIVQQARTHYMEDGDIFRAIDLLEMAVSARKDSTRPWQALFAIYRRENMPERFQRLVLAYRGAFGQDESWPAIRTLGYQLDPSNPLYAADEGLEPIPDDLVERWLGVPLDFTAHLLANEMHDQLMDTFPGRATKRKRMAGE